MTNKPVSLIWIDLEMTGLNPDTDRIIEIATIITDIDLNEIAEGPVIAIHQPESVLEQMDDWNKTTHSQSGLIGRIRESRYTTTRAERETLEFLTRHVPPGSSPMCGNSICQDRRFLARHMPDLERHFHYRNLDVSTLKILAALWHPPVAAGFAKSSSHQALADIRDSIAELRYYQERLLVTGLPGGPAS